MVRDIRCPLCDTLLGHYDGKGTIDILIKCKKCNIGVLYVIDKDKTMVRKAPERKGSSGLRFW